MSRTDYDICVIGGGAAGLVVAAGGASLGAKVALIENRKLGGDCLNYGCVPSKTLLHTARVAHRMREAGRFGLQVSAPGVDVGAVMRHVREVIATIGVHDSPERFRGMGVDVIFGNGQFSSSEAFEIQGRRVTARSYVIATGSRPAIPSVNGLEQVPYLTNESVFSLSEPVPRLIVMGGGPIGVEMAQAFARLGSDVALIESAPQILPREDTDMASAVEESLRRDGVELWMDCTARSIEGAAGDLHIEIDTADNRGHALKGSHLLVAAGRRANIGNLGLEHAGVSVANGYIKTDRRLRTTARRIYACGDVVGPYQFTHVAEHHAGVVLRNAIFRLPAKTEQRVIPWCTFTDPELARVGISEQEANDRGVAHHVYAFPFRDIDRARTDAEPDGLAKIITDPRGRLLGAALAGPHAGELIHEYVLAVARRMKAADLSGIIHIYPTLAQINRRVADQRMKEGLTPAARRWIQRLFRLRGDAKSEG